jgi:hypothetical protein
MLRQTLDVSKLTICLRLCRIVRSRRLLSTSSTSFPDPLPSILEDVTSPVEITSILQSGKGFKIRTSEDPTPRKVHGNLIAVENEYFIWRPQLYSPQIDVLDISPDAWGIFDVIVPKPGSSSISFK